MTDEIKNLQEEMQTVKNESSPNHKKKAAFSGAANGNRKIYLSVLIIFLLCAAMVIFAVVPLYQQIKEKSEELVFQRRELVLQEQKDKNFDKFKEFYDNNKANLDKAETLLVDLDVPLDFINFLESIARESQIELGIASASSKAADSSSWGFLTYQMTATGSFTSFLRFLTKIEASPYLTEVQGINIVKSDGYQGATPPGANDAPVSNVSVQFALKVYAK